MFRKLAKTLTAALLAFSISGCSLFMPWNQTISINGNPPDANVVVNGNTINAPGTVRVRRDKNVSIVVTKNGYQPFFMTSGYSLSACGILDIIGGFFWIVPLFGLLAPGAYRLDSDNFSYALTPIR